MPSKGKREPGTGREITIKPSGDKPFRNFLEAIPEDILRGALAAEPEESNFRSLLALMDASYPTRPTLVAMCRKANVTMNQVMNLMKDVAVAEGTVRMMLQLPQVMADVGEDAKSKTRTCSVCEGTGRIEKKIKGSDEVECKYCPNCDGEGTVREVGDKHARDLMFESAELINKPRGPLIEQNFDMRDTQLRKVMMETQDLMEPK